MRIQTWIMFISFVEYFIDQSTIQLYQPPSLLANRSPQRTPRNFPISRRGAGVSPYGPEAATQIPNLKIFALRAEVP
jgi:hypothetical protein